MKIAIIGTGIAGNTAAHRLHTAHDITVFEAASHIGGHTHTHRIEIDGEVQHIDTGFIVYNDRTYPNFSRLLASLGVATQPSSMSFSVRNEASGLEYNGTSLNGLFAQRRNLVRPSFLRMIREIVRFNREAPRLLDDGADQEEIALGDYLARHRYARSFVDDYLVPMGAAIWSTEASRMFAFPARFFVRFLYQHGMLSIDDRPVWRVVCGGSARYVETMVAPWRHRIRLTSPVRKVRRVIDGVVVHTDAAGPERFDHVFFACHADEALRLLADATPAEREVLGAFAFQRNDALLHTDASVLPWRRRAWAAWNYHVRADAEGPVALTYNMNVLQRLHSRHTFCVTLNRSELVAPARVLRRITYDHPLFTTASVAAQRRHAEISGAGRTHYCGAYWRYGFHEDGVVSALAAIARFERHHRHAQRDLQRVA
jgi:predicted NAD/FAD-binding protein